MCCFLVKYRLKKQHSLARIFQHIDYLARVMSLAGRMQAYLARVMSLADHMHMVRRGSNQRRMKSSLSQNFVPPCEAILFFCVRYEVQIDQKTPNFVK